MKYVIANNNRWVEYIRYKGYVFTLKSGEHMFVDIEDPDGQLIAFWSKSQVQIENGLYVWDVDFKPNILINWKEDGF